MTHEKGEPLTWLGQRLKRTIRHAKTEYRFQRSLSTAFTTTCEDVLAARTRNAKSPEPRLGKGLLPLHHSKSGKSLSVNVETGGFFCHGCGAKGDMVTFTMRKYNLSFIAACKSLGAWDSGPVDVRAQRERERKRDLQRKAEERLAETLQKLRLYYATELERYRDRSRRGLPYDPHEERRTAVAHAILSFAAPKDRLRFAAGDAAVRNAMIEQALVDGFVHTGDEFGHVMDVSL